MKKVLLSMMLCFLLVGCGNKLVCTASSDKMDSKVTFTIKDGKAAFMEEFFVDYIIYACMHASLIKDLA